MFLDFMEKRETEDDKVELTDAEKIFLQVFGINEDLRGNALKEATYFTCIKTLSEGIAKTPLRLVKETGEGTEEVKSNINTIVGLRPNPYMTAVDFKKAIEASRQHKGYGAAYKVYSRGGELKELIPCEITQIIIDDAGLLCSKLKNKVCVEFIPTGCNIPSYCTYEDMLILKSFTLDGLNAQPIKDVIRPAIDNNIKSQNYLNTLFDNGLTNKVVVQLTSDIKDENELKKMQSKFDRIYRNGKRIFTVPAGFSVQPLNLSLADAQYEQLRRMTISQIAAAFGIKMHQLNDLKDANNNSLEQQQLSFLIDTMLILYETWEQEFTWGLLTQGQRDSGLKFEFNTNVILRTNAETQQRILCGYVSNGIYTANEARLMLQKKKLEGLDDTYVNAGVLKTKDIGKNLEKKKDSE